MTTKYVQDGGVITWTNGTGSDVSSGDVVELGEQIGVALVDIADTESGSVAIEGVFTLPKVSAAVWNQGESVIWDTSAGAFDDNAATPATGDISGCCVAAADGASSETTADIKLNVGVGTVA